MGLSIQDYLKKINSWLTSTDIVSLFMTCVTIVVFTGYIFHTQREDSQSVIYRENSQNNISQEDQSSVIDSSDIRPFGSAKGKTYTFSWCQGSTRISNKNKIYFGSEDEAKGAGRTLSKLCKR